MNRSPIGSLPKALKVSNRERLAFFLERTLDRRLAWVGVALYRLTGGHIARLYGKDVLVLTTHGRRTGRKRTVLLQFFRAGTAMVLVAANSGLPTHPGWFYNLKATPTAQVQVMDRIFAVRAEEIAAKEATAFWPRILQRSPDYARYFKRTSRTIPLIRLIPLVPGEDALS